MDAEIFEQLNIPNNAIIEWTKEDDDSTLIVGYWANADPSTTDHQGEIKEG